jgi:hypothetical protein
MQGKRTAFSFSKKIVHKTRTKETCSLLSIEQLIPVFSIIDDTDVIFESTGILFIAIVLAHEITHAINYPNRSTTPMLFKRIRRN